MSRTPLLALTLAVLAACGTEPAAPEPGFDPVVELRLDPAQPVAVLLGGTFVVRVSAHTRSGTTVSTDSVRFRATNTAVIGVSSDGLVTAVGTGQAYVVAELPIANRAVTDSLAVSVICTLELRQEFDPPAKTLAVGESFTPRVTLSTCGGQVRLTDAITWQAVDTLVVTVDSTGLIATGRTPGSTHVRAVSAQSGLLGGIPVTVTP